MKRIIDGFGLLEAARWYGTSGLLFSDMTEGGVRGIDLAGELCDVVPFRKGIGGLALHASGDLVVTGRTVAVKLAGAYRQTAAVLLEPADDEAFFNDMTADVTGRVFVGSVGVLNCSGNGAARQAGRLYCLDLDGTATVIADDVALSNGLGLSPDGSTLFHVDSHARRIWAYDLHQSTEARARRPWVDTAEYAGLPDGLAVGDDGSVWVAFAGGGVVVAWDGAGRRTAEVTVPQPMVTSLCFGGLDRRFLYVLTGPDDHERKVGTGAVYGMRSDVVGLPASVARVPLARHPVRS